MYVESVPNRSSPPAILLRESYREQGRVKKRTLANLSDWPASLVEGFRTLLKGGVAVAADAIRIRRSLPHGHAVAALGTLRSRSRPIVRSVPNAATACRCGSERGGYGSRPRPRRRRPSAGCKIPPPS